MAGGGKLESAPALTVLGATLAMLALLAAAPLRAEGVRHVSLQLRKRARSWQRTLDALSEQPGATRLAESEEIFSVNGFVPGEALRRTCSCWVEAKSLLRPRAVFGSSGRTRSCVGPPTRGCGTPKALSTLQLFVTIRRLASLLNTLWLTFFK